MNAAGASIVPAPALAYRIHSTCYIVCIDQVLVKPCLMAGDFLQPANFISGQPHVCTIVRSMHIPENA